MTPVDSCSVLQRASVLTRAFQGLQGNKPHSTLPTGLLETEDNISLVLVSDEGVPGLWEEIAYSYRPGYTCRTHDLNTVSLVAVWNFLVKRIILKQVFL